MIPVSLTLQGIYSYQEKQTIDFTRLTSAGIFGIFGPVGSGKSTILEAITFALYGRTDRLNLSGDNRNYNMMNLKSNEMLIEFIFRAGPEHKEYMALVRSRRNSRQFEDVKACERTAYEKSGDEWIPVDVNTLENILGLSYDNFKRTVIIPQGRFQEFLFLKGAERSDMLKELFSLQRYELSSKVISLETRTLQHKQNIEGNLQQLADVSPEKIIDAENELAGTIAHIGSKASELTKLQEEERKMRHIKELTQKIVVYQSQQKDLKQQEQEITLLEKRLKSFEYCVLTFKEILGTYHNSGLNIEHLKGNIHVDSLRLQEISVALKKLEEEFESTIRKEYDEREVLKQKAEELSKIARITDLQERYQQFQVRIAKGEQEVLKTVQTVEELKNRIETLLLELKGLKEQSPDMTRLSKAREWFAVWKMLCSERENLTGERSVLTIQLDDLGRQKKLPDEEVFSGVCLPDNSDDIVRHLEGLRQAHEESMDTLNREKQHYQIQQKLEEYASGLHDGKPCPLCGSVSHPQKFNALNIKEALLKVEEQLKIHDQAGRSVDSFLRKIAALDTTISLKSELRNNILLKEEEVLRRIKVHQDLFCWEEFREEADLSVAFENAEKLKALTEQKEKELESVRLLVEKESRQKELYTNAIESLKANSLKELTVANTLRDQLVLLDLNACSHRNPDDLNAEKDNLLLQYRTIELKYQKTTEQMNLFRKDLDILSGKLETSRKMLEKEQHIFETVSGEIQKQLETSEYTLDEVKEILASDPDLDKERRRISLFRQELDFVEKQLLLLQAELKDQSFREDVYLMLLETIQTLQQELNRKNEEKGSLQTMLLKMKTDLDKRTRFEEDMTKTEQRLEDIRILKQLFKGSGFVKYISSVYLQELVHAANERFYKLSGQKLRLEITSGNDFDIRDFMNGGKTRNVKTLSGGQTFQAALSLALALSDNTRRLHGSGENFFFLDEGFGSLDKESLQIVFDTLKALRHENRIVGIISHVEEMNQEIDIHLSVKNDEERGSMIERSWERQC